MTDLSDYISKRTKKDLSQEDLLREGNRIAEAIEAVQIRKAREDVNAFIEYVFEVEQGAIHREWHDLIDDPSSTRTAIIAPRNHGKTTQISGRCLWEVGHDHDLRVKYVMGQEEKAKDIVDNIGDTIEHSEKLHRVFPDLKPGNKKSWTKSKLFVDRKKRFPDATFEASGVLSSAVSGRADKIVFDDIVTPKNAILQPALQKHVKYQYANAWLPTLEDFSPILYVATPWTDTDKTSEIMKADGWKKWFRPAIVDGKPIWPEKWTVEALEEKKIELGDRAYEQQYMLKMLNEGENVFEREGIEGCLRSDLYPGEGIEDDWPRYIGVDLARTSGGGNYTVFFKIAVDEQKRRWVMAVRRMRIRAADIAEKLVNFYYEESEKNVYPKVVMVENNAFQQIIIEQLTELDASIPVQGHYTGAKKHDLSMGVPSLATQIDNRGWVIPYAGDHSELFHECDICAWIDEMVAYPVGEHNDTVMAMWFADAAAKGGRFSKEHFNSWYNTPMTDAALKRASHPRSSVEGTSVSSHEASLSP
ncbi:MAG: hypothetical protein WC083_04635 [Candidatus Methanomethylophilaceae archaeon]